MNKYEISSEVTRLDVDTIHAFLAASYWSPGIPRRVVERAIANSLCFGAYVDRKQVAFARMVTDKATFAYLADVFVLPEHRGKGVSRLMMDAIVRHPDLQGLRRMLLATRDAHGLYSKYGFKPLAAPDRLMELHNPNVYAAGA